MGKHIKIYDEYKEPKKTIVILGLPGSGKSMLSGEIISNNPEMNYIVYDDFSYSTAIKRIGLENQIISDGYLMTFPDNKRGEIEKKAEAAGAEVEFVYFENDPVSAIENVKKRWKTGKGHPPDYLIPQIEQFSRVYKIPEGSKIISVWKDNK